MIAPKRYFFLDARQWALLGMLLFFAGVYGCISLVNHAMFRTHAHDLAYYNQAIFHFSRLDFGIYNMNYTPYWHSFGDHFEPILMLLAPMRYLFGTVTLLLVQIGSVLFGAVGLYRYVQRRTAANWLPHLAAFYFLSFWGIYGALAFDFHTSVLAAMILPWLFDAFDRKNWKAVAIWVLLFLMCGEKLAFWGIFLGLGLLWLHRKDYAQRIAALIFAGTALLWFVISIQFIIPIFLREGMVYRHFRYTHFGDSMGEMMLNLLQHPLATFSAFFTNHLPDHAEGDHLKGELHKMVLLSGGLILLFRPQYLLMLLPVYATKLLNDLPSYWGINMHYSIEFVPIISLAVFGWLVQLESHKLQYGLAIFIAILTCAVTVISFSTRFKPHYSREYVDIFDPAHWTRADCNPADLHAAVALVPDDVIVAASEAVTPHLSLRPHVYRFPKLNDAEYAVLMKRVDIYPFNMEQHQDTLQRMLANPAWETVQDFPDVVVLRRLGAGH